MFKTENIKPITSVELEILSEQEYEWRDSELINVIDHYQKPLLWDELTDDVQENVKQYRQELKDWDQQNPDFPNSEFRPVFEDE
jgi:hypothetical protein